MKFAHIRVSEYFTFAKQIFHSEAISLARRANFVKKSTSAEQMCFFLEVQAGFEPADNGVADRGLTTWLLHQIFTYSDIISKFFEFVNRVSDIF